MPRASSCTCLPGLPTAPCTRAEPLLGPILPLSARQQTPSCAIHPLCLAEAEPQLENRPQLEPIALGLVSNPTACSEVTSFLSPPSPAPLEKKGHDRCGLSLELPFQEPGAGGGSSSALPCSKTDSWLRRLRGNICKAFRALGKQEVL